MTLSIQKNSPNFSPGTEEVNTMGYKQAFQNLREHIDNMLNPFSAKDVLDKFAEILKDGIKYKKIVSHFQSSFQSLNLSESTKNFIKELGIAIQNDLNDNKSYLERRMQIWEDLTRFSKIQLKDVDMCPELKQLLSLPEVKKLENFDVNEIINCININNEDTLEQNLVAKLKNNSFNELEQKLVNELEERLKNLLGPDVARDINPQLKEAGFVDLHNLISKRIHQYLKRNVASALGKTLTLSCVIKKIQGKKTLEFRFTTIMKEGSLDIEKQSCIINCLSWIFSEQQKKPVSIILTNCVALTDKKLRPFWHNNLKYLDLRYSSVNTEIVEKISHQCKNLKKFYLSKCDQLEAMAAKWFKPEDPLNFPSLKILHITKCAKLTRVNIDAPNLLFLKANNNAKLKEISLLLLPLEKLNIDNCPLLENIPLSLKPIVQVSIPSIAFGKAEWGKYFGDIEAEPPLPANIEQILNEPCSFWPDKKVKETHLLVLIPSTVNGKPFTLNYLGELIQKPKSGHSTKYKYYYGGANWAVGDKSYSSHWVLMTRNIIPGSRYENYSKCCELIANHSKKTGLSYEFPYLLDATASILMHYVKTGERLYSDGPWDYTYSQDFDNDDPLGVGSFSAGGLSVSYYSIFRGVAGSRRL